MKAPQTLKRVSRSVGALLSRAKLITPKSTKSAQFDFYDEPINECEETGRDEEIDKLEKTLSSHTLSETVGSNSFKGENDYLKILQSGSSTLTDGMVGDLVEKELKCVPSASSDQRHSSELSVSTLGQVSCDDGSDKQDQATATRESRDLTTDREITEKEVRVLSVNVTAETGDQQPPPEDHPGDSQCPCPPSSSPEEVKSPSADERNEEISSSEGSNCDSPRLVLPPIQSGRKTVSPLVDGSSNSETPKSNASSARSIEFVKPKIVINPVEATGSPIVEQSEPTATRDPMVATGDEPDTGEVLENEKELKESGSTETDDSPKLECNKEVKSESNDTSAHSMETTEIDNSKRDLPTEEVEELTVPENSVASAEALVEGSTQAAFQLQADTSGSVAPPGTNGPVFFDNFGSIVDRLCWGPTEDTITGSEDGGLPLAEDEGLPSARCQDLLCCPQTTKNTDKETSAIAQAMEEATTSNMDKELVDPFPDPSVMSSPLSGASNTSSKESPQVGLPTENSHRQKPDLCVITKPDTFDEVADAALLVHDMANQSGSFDTVECEKIDKALTLLKKKAEELGIEESDLLAAMQSMDESDLLSPETTTE